MVLPLSDNFSDNEQYTKGFFVAANRIWLFFSTNLVVAQNFNQRCNGTNIAEIQTNASNVG